MKFYNRARQFTATTGIGDTITLGSAFSNLFLTLAQAGGTSDVGGTTSIVVEQGTDFAIYEVTIGASAGSVDIAAVKVSRIAGTVGTSRVDLDGSAVIRFIESAEDLNTIMTAALGAIRFDVSQPSLSDAEQNQALDNLGIRPKVGDYQIFTASGTFSKASLPAHVTHVIVHVIGAGGGGGGGNNSTNKRGTGGAGGGYARKRIAVASLSASETVTIGAGGTTGTTSSTPTAGGTGGTTSFGAHVSATGGVGGSAATGTALAGSGSGTGSGGDLNIAGESSPTNTTGDSTSVGVGGNAAAGYGSGGKVNVQENGKNYGGGAACNNHAGTATAVGAPGLCIVEW